jgi:hypothetical protein
MDAQPVKDHAILEVLVAVGEADSVKKPPAAGEEDQEPRWVQ